MPQESLGLKWEAWIEAGLASLKKLGQRLLAESIEQPGRVHDAGGGLLSSSDTLQVRRTIQNSCLKRAWA